jgi:hypothetical protein
VIPARGVASMFPREVDEPISCDGRQSVFTKITRKEKCYTSVVWSDKSPPIARSDACKSRFTAAVVHTYV